MTTRYIEQSTNGVWWVYEGNEGPEDGWYGPYASERTAKLKLFWLNFWDMRP